MSLTETRSIDLDLLSVLEGIEAGQVSLPNFQREFDWTDMDVKSLLGTIISGWPIGSLLLIEGTADETADFYAPRSFESAPPLSSESIYIVLDGQQRLTAMYQALYNRGPLVYALDLEVAAAGLADIDSIDDALVSIKRHIWDRKMPSPAEQWAAKRLPMAAMQSATDFFAWRDAAISRDDEEARTKLTNLYRQHLSGMHAYKIPAIVIKRGIQPAAVARIFERVNRTGWKLSTFDLMVARSFTQNFNLREIWNERRADSETLDYYLGKDGLPILNTIALRQRMDVRQSAVLTLPGSAIRDNFDNAVYHFERALSFARDFLGLLSPDWLPYKPLLTVMSALDYDLPLDQHVDLVRRWYWTTSFGQKYDVASNTRAVSDYRSLLNGKDSADRPVILIREVLVDSTRRQQGALHRAFISALGTAVVNNGFDPTDISRISELKPRSGFDSTHVRESEYHLRTLSFTLATKSEFAKPYLPMLPFTNDITAGPAEFIENRLMQLKRFLEGETGQTMKLLNEDDVNATDIWKSTL
ncbi:DUF262 domain-containing protein [Arthrobacter crystallopoietes]|uniref:DUF262 domain-containing protein n=1 Tax=Crystallibacter crystallopoietes TaxID=37928 RepID=UPI003D247380